MLKSFFVAVAFAALALPADAKRFAEAFPGIYAQLPAELKPGVDKIDLRQGTVAIAGADATLTVPENYYFIGAEDAQFILSKVWGNPEDTATLGMVFPTEVSPFQSDSWALEITFDAMGYVSDEDAGSYDYTEMLQSMRANAAENNKWRTENGYEAVELVGWAAEPHYDPVERKLHWAKLLRFGTASYNTLNYNVRALGRHGVLVLNFIASEDQLPLIEAALPDVLKMVSFDAGARYTDFLPGTDTVAAVGIGGLIAGKLAAKAGLIGVALVFLKKFWFLILLPILALKNKIFGGRKES